MKNNDCLIDLPNSSMRIKGNQVKLSFEGNMAVGEYPYRKMLAFHPTMK